MCSKCPTVALTHTFPQVFDQNFIVKTQLNFHDVRHDPGSPSYDVINLLSKAK